MISALDNSHISFMGGRFVNVPAEQRSQVEEAINRIGCTLAPEWTASGHGVTKYDDFSNELGEVFLWTLFIPSEDDAKNLQRELDAIA